MSFCLIITMVPNMDEAKKIAKYLVEKKHAACVNITPNVTSIYNWGNKLQEDAEISMFIKTKSSNFEIVKDEIIKLHSYEVPAISSIPIENGYDKFLNWVDQETIG